MFLFPNVYLFLLNGTENTTVQFLLQECESGHVICGVDLYLKPLSSLLLVPRVTEEESTATTMEALKARIRELEKQILRGDRYKCLICMVSIAFT